MRVASCSSCNICLRTHWIYLDTTRNRGRLRLRASVAARTRASCPHRWRRPGSAGRCATRPKPPQCRRCGAAAPPRRLLESACSCYNLARCVSREDCRGKKLLEIFPAVCEGGRCATGGIHRWGERGSLRALAHFFPSPKRLGVNIRSCWRRFFSHLSKNQGL